MTQWTVKGLSKITGVTVQTLHHYDHIDLLKPSNRQLNGYRLYSEKDLIKLQQIIALKFFGFELSHIKTLLKGHVNIADHFAMQAQFLEEKAKTLQSASQTLKNILSDCQENSIPWENIIKLIKVYRMTQELEKSWAGQVLTPDELTQYANFHTGLKTRFTEEQTLAFKQQWSNLLSDIRSNIDKEPGCDISISIAKKVMDRINALYGQENAAVRHTVWEKGIKGGYLENETSMTPEMVEWLDKAIDAYYRSRIYKILNLVGSEAPSDLMDQWNILMYEMFGNSKTLKQGLVDTAMTDQHCTPIVRDWLKKWILEL